MKHNQDTKSIQLNQEEKKSDTEQLIEKLEEACYIMIFACKAYRRKYGMMKRGEK